MISGMSGVSSPLAGTGDRSGYKQIQNSDGLARGFVIECRVRVAKEQTIEHIPACLL
jgi:hypothetical protein